jgi:hypothetical protein
VKWQAPPILLEERLLGYKSFSGTYVDLILNSGYPKLCCGIRFYYPKHMGLMAKDIPNRFYHYLDRTYFLVALFDRVINCLFVIRRARPAASLRGVEGVSLTKFGMTNFKYLYFSGTYDTIPVGNWYL